MIRFTKMVWLNCDSCVITHPNLQEAAANTMAEIVPGAIADIIEGSSVRVIDYANVPTAPSSPNYHSEARRGAVIGLVIALALCFADRLRSAQTKAEPPAVADFRRRQNVGGAGCSLCLQ